MIQEKIQNLIRQALIHLGYENYFTNADIIIDHPKYLINGDYSFTRVMKLYAFIRKQIKESGITGGISNPSSPKKLTEEIVTEINKNLPEEIKKVEAVGGFINFYLSRKFFSESIEEILNLGENVGKNKTLSGKKIMVEYTQPNPFKPFHIGHLMSNAIGESISRLVEFSGAETSRANYQGDVGLHVARAIYGLLKDEKLQDKSGSHNTQAANIGQAYVLGAGAYETDENAKKETDEINKKVYTKSDEKINEIYSWGFKVTMQAFEDLYKILGTKFDFYFLESQMMLIGQDIVRENTGIFEESDGAVVFKAEKHDPKLHTRVFITSAGLPTYETKELGLTEEKFKTKPNLDLSIVVTASEQIDYMRVVEKAISLIHPEYANKMKHITHGMMRFASGKMASRKGNVITGESLLHDVRDAILEKMTDRDFSNVEREKIATDVSVSAIKYSILKQGTGGDIIFDFDKSISVEGDSGPYLQYSYARANSIIEKAQKENILPDFDVVPEEAFEIEKLLYKFPEVVSRSSSLYEPHHIATYLIEIARSFNSFYGNNLIVNKEDKTSSYKIALTYAFSFIMKTGLYLLGIQAPKKM